MPPITSAAAAVLAAIPLHTIGANHQGCRLSCVFFMTSLLKPRRSANGECQATGGARGLPTRGGWDGLTGAAAKPDGRASIAAADGEIGAVAGLESVALPAPATGSGSGRTSGATIRGEARSGRSASTVVAGLKAEPNATVRGGPLLSSDEASATRSAIHSAAARNGQES